MKAYRNLYLYLLLAGVLVFFLSCSYKKNMNLSIRTIPKNSNIAVIVNAPDKVKNAVLMKFMSRGFSVKAVNASDFYSLDDIYDIRDFKRMSYIGSNDLLSLEKTMNNLYKMHVYNFEANKAEILDEMRAKWNIQYLILLNLGKWEQTSWGRAIDLKTNEIIWIENYPTSFKDSIDSILDRFITDMSGR